MGVYSGGALIDSSSSQPLVSISGPLSNCADFDGSGSDDLVNYTGPGATRSPTMRQPGRGNRTSSCRARSSAMRALHHPGRPYRHRRHEPTVPDEDQEVNVPTRGRAASIRAGPFESLCVNCHSFRDELEVYMIHALTRKLSPVTADTPVTSRTSSSTSVFFSVAKSASRRKATRAR